MCEYRVVPKLGYIGLVSMLYTASTTDGFECYSCGEVIHLWGNDRMVAYTFSYHLPHGMGTEIDYKNTLTTYQSEVEAGVAMANFVWAMNDLVNRRY